ncbi:LacI family DNA-binding transcriptional regulator [Metabacillus sp. RGM 3146]|uniref:LacI family DNA-binding transcriptional regulator n=1 Tax=Metabacillus sp. RGM 3146 TaxID=3401092 RepID=UPI003B995D68
MANIHVIAKNAGVSAATVSRVLNHHPYVKDEKRQAVYRAMEDLGYSRNMNAVNLSRGKTDMIGVVVPTINHPYFGNVVEGIAEEAMRSHLQLVLFQTNYEEKKELEALEQLKGKKLDGVIFCSRACGDSFLLTFQNAGPIILCEDSNIKEFPSISISHEEAFHCGLHYLIQKGHKKIAICLGRKEGANSIKRIQAYKNELGDMADEKWIFDKCLTIENGTEVIQKYLELENKPTAFLVTNDQVAAGMLLEAENACLSIPEDLAIMSFDNQPIAGLFNLSTIDIPAKRMGSELLKALLEERTSPGSSSRRKVLPFTLIERKTV